MLQHKEIHVCINFEKSTYQLKEKSKSILTYQFDLVPICLLLQYRDLHKFWNIYCGYFHPLQALANQCVTTLSKIQRGVTEWVSDKARQWSGLIKSHRFYNHFLCVLSNLALKYFKLRVLSFLLHSVLAVSMHLLSSKCSLSGNST